MEYRNVQGRLKIGPWLQGLCYHAWLLFCYAPW